MPRLDLYTNRELAAKIRLEGTSILVGRSSDCDVQIPNVWVSRHHARIEVDDTGGHTIEDLSANGTRLNCSMVERRTPLSPGDRIYIEDHVLIYRPDGAPSGVLEHETCIAA
jgi:pSer/pThr/pTyr-binding forkhead associated (FHA) protein